MTILSLVLTCLAVFVVFVPAILAGYNAYAVSVITCLFIIAMTLSLVSGPSKKSLAAALGCAGGVAVAGILSVVMDKLMKLTGYLNDETMYVSLLNEANPIDLKGIVFAAIVIGALGATMDVAMAISLLPGGDPLPQGAGDRRYPSWCSSGLHTSVGTSWARWQTP